MSLNSIVLPFVLLLFSLQATSQGTTHANDEKTIRDLIERVNQGKDSIVYTENRVWVSGPYPKPIVGTMTAQQQAIRDSLRSNRSNQKMNFTINRLEVAHSGDLAYEFGDFTGSYNNLKNEHQILNGSYVRAWKKVNGKWLVDVSFMRPNRQQ